MVTKKPLFSWVFERCRGLQLMLFAMILVTIFFRVFPLEMQKRIVNFAIRFKDLDALFLYCGLYIGAVVLAGLLKYVINVLQGYIAQKLLYEIREQLYDHILRLPLSFFRRTQPGMVITSLTSELSTVGDFLGSALAVPIINILTLFTFAGYMFYLNPLLALLSISIYPFEILIIPFLQKRFNRLNQDRINETRSLSNVIGEAIAGMHEIHGNASYPLENRKLARLAGTLFALRHRMNIIKFLIKFVNNFFQSLGPFTLFLVGGYLSIKGRLDLGALVAFLSAYEKLYDPWKELMDYYQDLQDSRVRYYQVMNYFDLSPEFALRPQEDREPYRLTGQIEIKNVDFLVDGQIRILDQISLTMKPGERLALVGYSGSGKSTLAMLMGQLYDYSRGHILVDGRELKSLTKMDISHNIGYVAQYPFIFNGTILENVLYACESLSTPDAESPPLPVSREDILREVAEVGLTEDILRFGLNTVLARDQHSALIPQLIEMRKTFYRRWKNELANFVAFFDFDRFLRYSTVGENITFGYPMREEYELTRLPRNAIFRKFLRETGLAAPLLQLGTEIARQTVSLLQDLQDDAFFFEMSPIPREEFDLFTAIVDRLDSPATEKSARQDEVAILGLALRFNPSRHKMAALSPFLEAAILKARQRFMETIAEQDPESFAFYRPTEYLFTHNILENVLFGHPKADQPQAMEQVQRYVVELLEEENLLDEVMGIGLEFEVGSKGDRLSGGQKQKIALARVLLKKPHILIMDEATASLDNRSQAKIQQLLSSELKGKCTLITVAHRLEMVRDYDEIAVMKAGKIIEMGRYEDLMAKKGLFYELTHGS